jgi:hypothetical protein
MPKPPPVDVVTQGAKILKDVVKDTATDAAKGVKEIAEEVAKDRAMQRLWPTPRRYHAI